LQIHEAMTPKKRNPREREGEKKPMPRKPNPDLPPEIDELPPQKPGQDPSPGTVPHRSPAGAEIDVERDVVPKRPVTSDPAV
jgi:hypothetical protein